MPAPLVASHPISGGALDRVQDGVVAVYVRGVYAGRLRHAGRGWGWGCDADLTAALPWPRGSRAYFASVSAALQTFRRRLRDAEREARHQAYRRAHGLAP